MRYSGIGGQAVIEGVMMKNRDQYAVAVRKPDGKIEVKKEMCNSVRDKYKIAGIPVIRGVVSFVESLMMGIGTLNYSASFFEDEEGEEKEKEKSSGKKEDLLMMLVTVAAVIIAVGVFLLAPFLISEALRHTIRSPQMRGLLEGVIRVVLFVAYVKLISLMKDIKRVFMYHGAEHKVINCLENGQELTTENVRKQSLAHKRCGTSFLLIVMFLSILLFMFIAVKQMWLRMVLRILLIPVIAGIAYEYIRYVGKHDNKVIDVISKPGLLLQSLTTAEPDDSMIEVAIASVDAVFDWKEFISCADEAVPETAASSETEEKGEGDIEILNLDDGDEEEDEILNALNRYFEAPEEKTEEEKK